jgi:hypothetical protein
MGIETYILLFHNIEFVDHITGELSRKELLARLSAMQKM